jgi:hypothetical protein
MNSLRATAVDVVASYARSITRHFLWCEFVQRAARICLSSDFLRSVGEVRVPYILG